MHAASFQECAPPTTLTFRPARAADQSFLASGMPSFSAYPFLVDGHPDKRPWTGGCGNAWWWHTEHDTLDKADVSILATDVKVGIEAVWGFVNAAYLPLDYRATIRELIEAVRGRPPSPAAMQVAMSIGLGLILLLMVFATYNDIMRMVS